MFNGKKTVLITGASRGIGAACAELFCEAGYNVVINYNNSGEKADMLAERLQFEGYSAVAFQADISDAVQADNLFKEITQIYGGVDILVNNAGIAEQKLVIDMTDGDWKRMIGNNLNSCFYASRRALPYMLDKKWGRIINVSSIWGIHGASMEAHYSASKAGIIGFTRALALEYAPSGITVNCVAPGVINTDMIGGFNSSDRADIISAIPAGRLGTPSEVAELVLFLASDHASYITGEIIGINGGYKG
jgi:3-oxoacyl-[acyl-carrier protein] reductase